MSTIKQTSKILALGALLLCTAHVMAKNSPFKTGLQAGLVSGFAAPLVIAFTPAWMAILMLLSDNPNGMSERSNGFLLGTLPGLACWIGGTVYLIKRLAR